MPATTATPKPAETPTAATAAAAVEQTVTAFKGFDAQLRCRGYQYEVGKTYEHTGKVEACASGFHGCQHPLDVFGYYPPAGSRFAEVVLGGEMDGDGSDTKIAAARITINIELSIGDLVRRAWDYVWSRATIEGKTATGDQGAASATGPQGAASATGTQGAASATGTQGAASATGYQGAASATGDQGAASATGTQGAASATGTRGAASATGTRGAAEALHPTATAHASGPDGRARGVAGAALHLDRRADGGAITHAWSGIVGRDGVEPMVWYSLDDGGRPIADQD
ncbi:hypothetical protein RHODOP_05065 [Rhodoplanes sp. P11]|uniref:DUF7666 domain-containing protein n=1 Tax=Rhodoplanes sp. P11 TaxID=3157621 RepID=UPI0035E7E18D